MSEEVAKGRIEPWLAPIAGASPAGEDMRYDPLHEQIRAEAAKLENPAGGPPDWARLVKQAEQLTSQKSKDLLIEAYAAYGLYQVDGLLGLASGVFLLAESMERFWDTMHPPAKRLRARVNAVQWLTEKLETQLPERQVGAGDHAAVTALDAAIKRLRSIVADKFEDQAPALRPVAEAIERLKMSLPEGGGAAPPPAAAPAPAPAPAAEAASDTEPPPPGDAPAPAEGALAAPAPAAPAPAAPAPAAAAPAAPPAPAARDLAAELAEAAKKYVEPIPGDAPAGIDAKFEPEHEELRNDIAALDSPSGGNVDWPRLVPRAGKILTEKSKDLLIATYLAFALWETQRIRGLAIGLEVISQICERYWEGAFPPVARIRGRANALAWLLGRVETALGQLTPTTKDKADVELLEASAKRFTNVVRDKFEDAAPSVRPFLETVQRVAMSVPEEAPPPPPPPPRPAAQAAAPAPRPAAAPAAAGAPVSLEGAPPRSRTPPRSASSPPGSPSR
ncbi:MAG: type VI secretion system ImpA family N-terminal domain-containing protein [Sandaracinaceae bacterium]|nr:type VI secretion system ImpA family N-terminal domain-containing protein [Sandaracinaceae bacterium]